MVRRNKYNAKKTEVDGIMFDSKAEAERYKDLKALESCGYIRNLELQPKWELQPSFRSKHTNRKVRAITYTADFLYYDCETGQCIVEDVKGYDSSESRLRRKLLEYQYGIYVKLVK